MISGQKRSFLHCHFMQPRFHVFLDGEVTAAFPEAVVQSMLASGAINGETPLCREGTDVWDTVNRSVSISTSLPAAPAPSSHPRIPAVPPPKRRWGGGDTLGLILIVLFCLWYCDGKSRKPAPSDAPSSRSSTRESGKSRMVYDYQFGDTWPLTVHSGTIEANGPYLLFTHDGTTYALNGLARPRYPAIDPIWKMHPGSAIRRMDISPLMKAAEELR